MPRGLFSCGHRTIWVLPGKVASLKRGQRAVKTTSKFHGIGGKKNCGSEAQETTFTCGEGKTERRGGVSSCVRAAWGLSVEGCSNHCGSAVVGGR